MLNVESPKRFLPEFVREPAEKVTGITERVTAAGAVAFLLFGAAGVAFALGAATLITHEVIHKPLKKKTA